MQGLKKSKGRASNTSIKAKAKASIKAVETFDLHPEAQTELTR